MTALLQQIANKNTLPIDRVFFDFFLFVSGRFKT